MGGGVPFVASLLAFGLVAGKGGGLSVVLFNPNDSADLLGGGLITFFALFVSGPAVFCLTGRGGREGSDGGTDLLGRTAGKDLVGLSADLVGLGSSVTVLLGGRGGSFEGS